MSYQLKDFFDLRIVGQIAADIQRVHRRFQAARFIGACMDGLGRLELLERGGHICDALRRHLPDDFDRAAAILVGSLGPELEATEGNGMAPFKYLPHTLYVARHGLDHFETSMRAQYELTRRFSAEASIRPFLERHPERTYARLLEWTADPSVHVRRLASEGTRPRLPWAGRLRAFQADPRPVIALLERLRDDPEPYVQRSVANSLNDIGKDHPALLVETCRRWSPGAGETRRWIIRHALRSRIKAADPAALGLLGFAAAPAIRVGAVALRPRRVRIGETLAFSVEIASTSRARQTLLVDYRVHFVKASGKTSAKVFKLRAVELAPRATAVLDGRVSFAHHTTRRPHPGAHRLELIVNGQTFPLGEVSVAG